MLVGFTGGVGVGVCGIGVGVVFVCLLEVGMAVGFAVGFTGVVGIRVDVGVGVE